MATDSITMDMDLEFDYEHPAWLTAVSTGVAWGLLVFGLAILLFGVPYLVFKLLL